LRAQVALPYDFSAFFIIITNMIKKTFRLFCLLLTFLLMASCTLFKTSFTLTIEDQYSAAYFIEIEQEGSDKGEFIGAINPGTTVDFEFDMGTVIDKVNFYSGIDLKTKKMKLQCSYNKPIKNDMTLVLKDGTVEKGK